MSVIYPKASQNFLVVEFVPKIIWEQFGVNCTWFINERTVKYVEFLKSFFTTYYKNKLGNDKVKNVLIIINNWHIGGVKQYSGFRPPDCSEGGKLSQHKFKDGVDTEIIIVMNDGSKKEVDYKEVHEVIQKNEAEFMSYGVSSVEDVSIATGWLHSDFRWIPNAKNILVVKPVK